MEHFIVLLNTLFQEWMFFSQNIDDTPYSSYMKYGDYKIDGLCYLDWITQQYNLKVGYTAKIYFFKPILKNYTDS